MDTEQTFVSDQFKFAKQGAENLARQGGYKWTNWCKGNAGRHTAGFEREGEFWSFDFYWTPKEDLSILAKNIERMDYMVRVAMKEFSSLKLGALMRQVKETAVH